MFDIFGEKKKKEKMFELASYCFDKCNSLSCSTKSPPLSALERALYIINSKRDIYSFAYEHGEKAYMMYIEPSHNSGLVYNGHGITVSQYFAVPHHYGEIYYRSSLSCFVYCGYFDEGMLTSEGRFNLSKNHTYNGDFSSKISENNEINISFI